MKIKFEMIPNSVIILFTIISTATTATTTTIRLKVAGFTFLDFY
jgi:hypothetical protein